MNVTLMTVRITPEILPIKKQNTATNTEKVNVELSSDDASEIILRNACLLMDDGVNNDNN